MLKSVIVLLAVTIIFIVVVIIELRLEASEWYYNCYKRMQYSYNVKNFKCAGLSNTECKRCPYYKRHLKSINKLKNKEKK